MILGTVAFRCIGLAILFLDPWLARSHVAVEIISTFGGIIASLGGATV